MPHYPREFKEAVRDAWVSGRFPTVTALAKHFEIARVSTVYDWKRKGKWDRLREIVRDRVAQEKADIYAERYRKMNDIFHSIWMGVVQGVAARLVDPKTGKSRVPAMKFRDILLATRILREAQHGARLTVLQEDQDVEEGGSVIIEYTNLRETLRTADDGHREKPRLEIEAP